MDEQQQLMQQQIVQLVQAAMLGDEKANQQIELIMQAAQQGDEQAAQIAQYIQQVAQQMKQSAKFGAKLNYIKYLRGQCPNGYEMQAFKKGGKVCKKCIKKADNGLPLKNYIPEGPVDQFRQDRIQQAKCGKKIKKAEEGGVTSRGSVQRTQTDRRKLPQSINNRPLNNRPIKTLPAPLGKMQNPQKTYEKIDQRYLKIQQPNRGTY